MMEHLGVDIALISGGAVNIDVWCNMAKTASKWLGKARRDIASTLDNRRRQL